MNAPVVLFVYNRPHHTAKTLDALSKNKGAENIVLHIYADGLKPEESEEQKQKHTAVREIICAQKWCKSLKINFSDSNLGLKKSIVKGVSEVVEKYGKVIVLEDDIVVSTTFNQFMNLCLNKYENEDNVSFK